MARISGDDFAKRLEAKTRPVEPQRVDPPTHRPERTTALSRKEQLSRQGLSFTGYYVNEKAREQLRDLAYRTRRDKQDLFREAMNLLFEKYDMDAVYYD